MTQKRALGAGYAVQGVLLLMFTVLQICLAVLGLKFAENGKKRHRPQSRLFENRFAIGAASFVFLVDISLFVRIVIGEGAVVVQVKGPTSRSRRKEELRGVDDMIIVAFARQIRIRGGFDRIAATPLNI